MSGVEPEPPALWLRPNAAVTPHSQVPVFPGCQHIFPSIRQRLIFGAPGIGPGGKCRVYHKELLEPSRACCRLRELNPKRRRGTFLRMSMPTCRSVPAVKIQSVQRTMADLGVEPSRITVLGGVGKIIPDTVSASCRSFPAANLLVEYKKSKGNSLVVIGIPGVEPGRFRCLGYEPLTARSQSRRLSPPCVLHT